MLHMPLLDSLLAVRAVPVRHRLQRRLERLRLPPHCRQIPAARRQHLRGISLEPIPSLLAVDGELLERPRLPDERLVIPERPLDLLVPALRLNHPSPLESY